MFVLDTARESAVNPTDLDFVFFHGSTDTPTIDIFVRGGAQVADDLAYGGFSDYASLAPGTYTLDVADATTGAFLASFLADVTAEMAGRAAGVGLLGFSDPSANQNGAPLSLTALFAEGAVAWLPAALPTGIEAAANDNEIVTAFALSQNYPNPFNPNSTISFALPEPHLVRLKVYNMAGQWITTLVNDHLPAGRYTVEFISSDLASGLYVYVIEAGAFRETRAMTLLK